MNSEEYNKRPEDLDADGNAAYDALISFLKENDSLETGGCVTFYSPQEWADRGESYGLHSVLIVAHDGGDVAPYFNYDYGDSDKMERMREALAAVGFWPELCTGWYTAIYKN